MNRNLLLLFVIVFASALATAQTDFRLKETGYMGALNAEAANDWTTGWTNFDPKNTVYGDITDTITLNAMISTLTVPGEKDITGTTTLDATKVYLLKGFVVVRSGGKLVIPAGTIIRAIADLNTTPKNYASIIVERGGKIEITGTSTKPVVITSAKAVGARERGDWGGLLIAGKAPHNLLDGTTNNNVQMEGFNGITFDANLAKFGGTDPNDNSGIIRYLRLEFGGLAFEVNKEINGLTLGAVGAATTMDHVQVSFSNDDSFEWFGGGINSTHLIAWKGTDDDFDTDNGYSGLNQFGIGVKDSAYFDGTYALASGASTSEGFESDNEATGTANVKPYTNAVFSNFTMIGPVPVGKTYIDLNSTAKAAFRRGARIRRNSALRIMNSVFMGYRNFVMIDGDSTLRNTNFTSALALLTAPNNTAVDVKAKQAMFSNNLIVNTTAGFTPASTTANGLVEVSSATYLIPVTDWVKQTGALANKIDPVAFTDGTVLVKPLANSTNPDFKPVAGSPALSGANFKNNPVLTNLFTDTKEIRTAEKVAPIYPNPISKGTLYFGREVLSYGIFDNTGRLVAQGLDTDHANVQNLSKGIYFIKLDGKVQKLIVQ
jgi:Secretion system C-terminal sorting domain